jgi:hypothetical protein
MESDDGCTAAAYQVIRINRSDRCRSWKERA